MINLIFINIMSKDIIIFTDGSTLNNQSKYNKKGGVGVFFGKGDKRNISYSLNNTKYKITNQVAELLGVIKGLETIIKTEKIGKRKIIIYSDSMYVINSYSKWAKNWEKNNWKKSNGKTVDNLKLMKTMYYLASNLKVKMIHVRAHMKEPNKDDPKYFIWYGNNMADKLAVSASNKEILVI